MIGTYGSRLRLVRMTVVLAFFIGFAVTALAYNAAVAFGRYRHHHHF